MDVVAAIEVLEDDVLRAKSFKALAAVQRTIDLYGCAPMTKLIAGVWTKRHHFHGHHMFLYMLRMVSGGIMEQSVHSVLPPCLVEYLAWATLTKVLRMSVSTHTTCSEDCRDQTLSNASTIDVRSNLCCREDAAFSFNGGKDSTVLLHLIRAALEQRQMHGQVQLRSSSASSAATSGGVSSANSTSGGAASATAVEPGADNRDGQAKSDGFGTATCADGVIHSNASSLPEGAGIASEGLGAAARLTIGSSSMITRMRTFVFHRPDDFGVRSPLQRVPTPHLQLHAGCPIEPAHTSSLLLASSQT